MPKEESFSGIHHIGNGKARLLLFAVGPFFHGTQRWKATAQRFTPLEKLYLYRAFETGLPDSAEMERENNFKNDVRNRGSHAFTFI